MKRTVGVALLLAALLAGAVAGFAEAAPTPSPLQPFTDWMGGAVNSVQEWARETGELEVRGEAVRTVAPDTVTINVGVRVEDKSEKVAQERANTVIADVAAALKALGVEESQMGTSGYNVTRKSDGKLLSNATYVARISLRITVRDFDLINQILDTSVELGANEISNISFSHSDEGAVYKEALQDAILAAQEKARAMASTAGVELHTLLTLREGSTGAPYYNSYLAMSEESGSGGSGNTQIMAGDIEISASVTLVYQIK